MHRQTSLRKGIDLPPSIPIEPEDLVGYIGVLHSNLSRWSSIAEVKGRLAARGSLSHRSLPVSPRGTPEPNSFVNTRNTPHIRSMGVPSLISGLPHSKTTHGVSGPVRLPSGGKKSGLAQPFLTWLDLNRRSPNFPCVVDINLTTRGGHFVPGRTLGLDGATKLHGALFRAFPSGDVWRM